MAYSLETNVTGLGFGLGISNSNVEPKTEQWLQKNPLKTMTYVIFTGVRVKWLAIISFSTFYSVDLKIQLCLKVFKF